MIWPRCPSTCPNCPTTLAERSARGGEAWLGIGREHPARSAAKGSLCGVGIRGAAVRAKSRRFRASRTRRRAVPEPALCARKRGPPPRADAGPRSAASSRRGPRAREHGPEPPQANNRAADPAWARAAADHVISRDDRGAAVAGVRGASGSRRAGRCAPRRSRRQGQPIDLSPMHRPGRRARAVDRREPRGARKSLAGARLERPAQSAAAEQTALRAGLGSHGPQRAPARHGKGRTSSASRREIGRAPDVIPQKANLSRPNGQRSRPRRAAQARSKMALRLGSPRLNAALSSRGWSSVGLVAGVDLVVSVVERWSLDLDASGRRARREMPASATFHVIDHDHAHVNVDDHERRVRSDDFPRAQLAERTTLRLDAGLCPERGGRAPGTRGHDAGTTRAQAPRRSAQAPRRNAQTPRTTDGGSGAAEITGCPRKCGRPAHCACGRPPNRARDRTAAAAGTRPAPRPGRGVGHRRSGRHGRCFCMETSGAQTALASEISGGTFSCEPTQ